MKKCQNHKHIHRDDDLPCVFNGRNQSSQYAT